MFKQILSKIKIGEDVFEGLTEISVDGFKIYRLTGTIIKTPSYVRTIHFDLISSILKERNTIRVILKNKREVVIEIIEKDALTVNAFIEELETLLKERLQRATSLLTISSITSAIAKFFKTISDVILNLHGDVNWRTIEKLFNLIIAQSEVLIKFNIIIGNEIIDSFRKAVVNRDTKGVINVLRRLIINIYNSISIISKNPPVLTPEWGYLKELADVILILEAARVYKGLGNTYEFLKIISLSSKLSEKIEKITNRDLGIKINYVISGELNLLDYFSEISNYLKKYALSLLITFKL